MKMTTLITSHQKLKINEIIKCCNFMSSTSLPYHFLSLNEHFLDLKEQNNTINFDKQRKKGLKLQLSCNELLFISFPVSDRV